MHLDVNPDWWADPQSGFVTSRFERYYRDPTRPGIRKRRVAVIFTTATSAAPATVELMYSAFAKLGRAKVHRDQLKDEVMAYREREPHGFEGRQTFDRADPNESTLTMTVHINEEMPDTWGLIIGDVLTNLRAALDHAVTTVTRRPERSSRKLRRRSSSTPSSKTATNGSALQRCLRLHHHQLSRRSTARRRSSTPSSMSASLT